MNVKQSLGKFGENIAAKYLQKSGYKIIEKNYRCKYGEIDIIASYRDLLVFVEVKTRNNNNKYGSPVEAITKTKQKHIYNAGTYYLLTHKINYNGIRIDAIEVYIRKSGISINHIKSIIEDPV